MLEQQKAQGISLEELSERYFNDYVFELINGQEIPLKPAKYDKHTMMLKWVDKKFKEYIKKTKYGSVWGWGEFPFAVIDDSNVVIGSLVPDLMFFRWGRWGAYLKQNSGHLPKPLLLAPDIAIEIVDPTDTYSNIMSKVDFYIEHDVQLVWLLDIKREVVIEHSQLYPDGVKYRGDEVVSGGDDAPDFSFVVSDIFDVEDDIPNLKYEEVVQLAHDVMAKSPADSYTFRHVRYIENRSDNYWRVVFDILDENGDIILMDPSRIYVKIIDATAEVSIPPQF